MKPDGPLSLRELARRIRSLRVLVVGDLLADHYLFGQTERVSREAPVLIVRQDSEVLALGGGANVAANARSLGAKVTALGVLGKDPVGRALRRLFVEQGIRLVVPAFRNLLTETRTRILAGGVSTTRQQMLRIDSGATPPLPEPVEASLERSFLRLAARHDVIVVSDYGAGVASPRLTASIKAVARSKLVCADSRTELGAFQGMGVCKPNEPELATLMGRPAHTNEDLLAAGLAALKRLSCKHLVVSRGRQGMALFSRGSRPALFPAIGQSEAVDVTGAGDTVLASLAVAFGAGATPREAVRFANLAASVVVQKAGTATVTFQDLAHACRE